MLSSITLESFKNHVHTELAELGQLTALVGPNGVGKTSVLQAVRLVESLGAGPWKALDALGAGPLRHRFIRTEAPSFRLVANGAGRGEPWALSFEAPRGPD